MQNPVQSQEWLLGHLDRVNRVIQGADDFSRMLDQVLELMIEIFESDRAWLLHPCDPAAPTWKVAHARTRPGYTEPALGPGETMTPDVAAVFQAVRSASGPVVLDCGTDPPVAPTFASRLGIQSALAMSLRPIGAHPYLFALQPFQFAMHQCSRPRAWTDQERRLFAQIAQRVSDALAGLLILDELRQSQAVLQHAQRVAQIGHWFYDIASGKVTWSDEVYRIHGLALAREPLTYEDVLALVHADDRENVRRSVNDALCLGGRYDREYQTVRPGGEIRYVHCQGEVTCDAAGRPQRIFGTVQDVTDRRRAENALRASEARFRVFVDHAMDAFFLHDENGRVIDINAQACASLGYAREELLGRLPTLFDPNFGPREHSQLRERVATGQVFAFDTVHRRKDGTEFPVEVKVRGFADAGRRFAVSLARDMTTRHQSEQALRRSEEHLTALIQSVDGIVWEAEPKSVRFTFVSPRAERLLGYPAAQWTSEPSFWENHIHPADRDEAVTRCRRCVEERRGHEFEYRMVAADGREVWLRDIVTVVLEDGEPAKLRGIMVDITRQKQADERIRRLNRTYAVLSEINELIVRERSVPAITSGACRVAVGQGRFALAWLALAHPVTGRMTIAGDASATPGTRPVIEAILRDGQLQAPRARAALESGSHAVCNDLSSEVGANPIAPVLLQCGLRSAVSLGLVIGRRHAGVFTLYASEPGFFDADELRLLDELAVDIAFALETCEHEFERQRAVEQLRASEDELRRREEHFRLLIEHAADLILVINSAAIVRFASPSVAHAFGRPREELVGRNALDLIHPDDLNATTAVLRQAIERPLTPVSIEHRVRRRDGGWLTLHTIGRSIPDQAADGFIVLNSRDITESRVLEEQFRQSQKMDAIGQLAGGVAHDFNNILAAIMMQAELAAGGQRVSDDVRDSLHLIRGAAERAANLTRQLLVFSRRQIMQPRDVNLNGVVTNLIRMLQRIIGEDVRLELELHPAPLIVRADAGMLDQVLLNLAVNARDAMPGGGRLSIATAVRRVEPTITRAVPDAVPGQYAILTVTDTGVGIAPDVRPRIFEPFFTTKERGKGTGLGLATVFGIVKQHRGWIDVTSEPGRGAKFTLFLPLSPAAHEEPRPVQARPKDRVCTETVLVAEDDAAVRFGTRAVLERAGYTVIEAASGPEALAAWDAREGHIALLLTDLVMPAGVSGYELAKRLRKQQPDLKVIYVSGYSAEVAGREVDLTAGKNFLQKPFSPDELLAVVHAALSG